MAEGQKVGHSHVTTDREGGLNIGYLTREGFSGPTRTSIDRGKSNRKYNKKEKKTPQKLGNNGTQQP